MDKRFKNLLFRFTDGQLNKDELRLLEVLIQSDQEALEYYCDFVMISETLRDFSENYTMLSRLETVSYKTLTDDLKTLASYEETADTVHLKALPFNPKIEFETEHIQKLKRPQNDTLSKFSIITFIMSTALILFMVLFARFAPVKRGVPVATLKDSLNAKWAVTSTSIQNGQRFVTRSNYSLQEGFAKLLFDCNTWLILEGPAEIEILAHDQVFLKHGRLYARVPPEGFGFQITTDTAKIIDLGTEFGIQKDLLGNLELHVLNGKTKLVSASHGVHVNIPVNAGDALQLERATGQVKSIAIQDHIFVRDIDSKANMVWDGKSLDMADIVGNGNGFGSGHRGSSLEPEDGSWHKLSALFLPDGFSQPPRKLSEPTYQIVSVNPFVDGIFVPNADNGPVIISSDGHVFKDAPRTSGLYWYGPINWCAETETGRYIVFDNKLFGTPENPLLFMHSNLGITFDLDAIRQRLPNFSITEFYSLYEISDGHRDKSVKPKADFWVLVDGVLKFSNKSVKVMETGTVRIPLSPSNRFLTLVNTTTESDGAIKNHWCVWKYPTLKLKLVNDIY